VTAPDTASVVEVGAEIIQTAKEAAANPWAERLMRFGYIARGLIYIIIGALAIQLVMGAGGATTAPTSAIALLGRQPLGKLLLVLVAVGLAGYALWGVVRAVFDPLRRGSDAKGWLARGLYLADGVTYALLLIPTLKALFDQPQATGGSAVPPPVRQSPYSFWLLAAFGLGWLLVAARHLYSAFTGRFMRDLNTASMSAKEKKTALWGGRIGYAARGVVFGLVGIGIMRTAWAANGPKPTSIDSALAALAAGPHGLFWLGLVALGLLLFGLYSFGCAKWARIDRHEIAADHH
jgi:hypothetical protein